MNRRDLLAVGEGLALTQFPFRPTSSVQASGEGRHDSDQGIVRHPVLVHSALHVHHTLNVALGHAFWARSF